MTITATIDVVTGELTISNPADIDGISANRSETEPWGAEEENMDRADTALADLGYRRVTEWAQSDAPDSEWTCTVRVRTGRPALDPDSATRAVPVRMTDTMLAELDRRAFTHGNRSEQIRRAVAEYLRGDYGAPTITATRDDDPQAIVDQISDVLAYLQRTVSTISQAAEALRWMGDDEFEHRCDAANGAIGELYAALSQAEAPYAQRAREAACAAIPEGV